MSTHLQPLQEVKYLDFDSPQDGIDTALESWERRNRRRIKEVQQLDLPQHPLPKPLPPWRQQKLRSPTKAPSRLAKRCASNQSNVKIKQEPEISEARRQKLEPPCALPVCAENPEFPQSYLEKYDHILLGDGTASSSTFAEAQPFEEIALRDLANCSPTEPGSSSDPCEYDGYEAW